MAKLFNIIIILITFSSSVLGENVKKYDWLASESAPQHYLMQVVRGDFSNENGSIIYIPDGKDINQGWGIPVSSHVVGDDLKPLPSNLDIIFFSYFENVFYHGKFDLPYEDILLLFNNGFYSPTEKDHTTFNKIIAGVSPGGFVSVWLSGIDKKIEIFSGQADVVEGVWSWISDNPKYSRSEYISTTIKDELSTSEIDIINKNGIKKDIWQKYHMARYNWLPKFSGITLRDQWIDQVKYYNGEEEYINYPLSKSTPQLTRGVPKELHFVWTYDKDTNFSYELYFDEKEMFEVFYKLGSKKQPLQLEMKLFDTEKGKKFSVELSNDKEGVFLKKFRLETYGAN